MKRARVNRTARDIYNSVVLQGSSVKRGLTGREGSTGQRSSAAETASRHNRYITFSRVDLPI